MDEQNLNNQNNQSNNYYQDNTGYVQPQFNTVNNTPTKTPGTAIAGLILGILAIVFSCCCGGGLLFGIIGLICGICGNKKSTSGVGTAGIVCSIIGILLGIIGLVMSIPVFIATLEELESGAYYY